MAMLAATFDRCVCERPLHLGCSIVECLTFQRELISNLKNTDLGVPRVKNQIKLKRKQILGLVVVVMPSQDIMIQAWVFPVITLAPLLTIFIYTGSPSKR